MTISRLASVRPILLFTMPAVDRLHIDIASQQLLALSGLHEERLIGQPVSFGCVRMRNADIADLYERVPADCRLRIE